MREDGVLNGSARSPFASDVIFAGVLLAIDSTVAALEPSQAPRSSPALTVAILLAASVPIAWRRSHPVVVVVLTLGALVAHELLGYPQAPLFGPFVAVYSLGAYRHVPVSVPAGGAAIAIYLMSRVANVLRFDEPFIAVVPSVTVPILLLALGATVRRTREYAAQLEDRALSLEREREDRARRAVEEERARIARELHDVVAHSVTVMVVQAGAARRVLADDPGKAAEALRSIEGIGRNGLVEMRRLLGVLATDEEFGPLEPRPGTERLEDLVEQAREVGLEVDLVVEGERRRLPAGVELSAYRIVQEALTNSVRHGRAKRARVAVRYGSTALGIEIADEGLGDAAGGGDGSGRGLIGMRERAAMLGGELDARPLPDGGFVVRATLPIEPVQT